MSLCRIQTAWRQCIQRRAQFSSLFIPHPRSLATLTVTTRREAHLATARAKRDDPWDSTEHDDESSHLGLRSNLPPDTPPPEHNEKAPKNLSDQEWEIRTGRAIYVLQRTLPDLFEIGIVTSVDKATGALPGFSTPAVNVNPLDPLTHDEGQLEDIYSPRIAMSYTPPVPLPAPFPKTLHLEGLPFYLAFSSFVRHTLNALYSDLQLTLTRFVVNTPKSSSLSSSSQQKPGDRSPSSRKRSDRNKTVLVSFRVTGTSRVSGALAEWDLTSTYSFSPKTGLIEKHVVDSIYPAPHQAVYDSLRLGLGKVFNWGLEGGPSPGAGRAACTGDGGGGERPGFVGKREKKDG